MFTFKFNFDEEEESCNSIDSSAAKTETSSELQWLPAKQHLLSSEHLKVFEDVGSIEEVTFGKTKIKFISMSTVENIALKDSLSANISPAFKIDTDLIPAVYEGGLKIWECTWDLLKHLDSSNINFKNCKVLELGCGTALPAIYTAICGAQITIQDYNEEVIDLVTAPNVILNLTSDGLCINEGNTTEKGNTPEEGNTTEEGKTTEEASIKINVPDNMLKEIATKASFYSGDWGSFTTMLSDVKENNGNSGEKFDWILTSETIYNPECHQKLLNVLTNNLKSSGTILLAAKSHYFGVGGGTQQFIDLVNREGKLDIKTHVTNSIGVTREILEMHHKS